MAGRPCLLLCWVCCVQAVYSTSRFSKCFAASSRPCFNASNASFSKFLVWFSRASLPMKALKNAAELSCTLSATETPKRKAYLNLLIASSNNTSDTALASLSLTSSGVNPGCFSLIEALSVMACISFYEGSIGALWDCAARIIEAASEGKMELCSRFNLLVKAARSRLCTG